MHILKVFSIAVLMSTVMSSSVASSVMLEFDENNNCSVECADIKKNLITLIVYS